MRKRKEKRRKIQRHLAIDQKSIYLK